MENLIKKFNSINFNNDDSIIEFICSIKKSDIFSGTNECGETFVLSVDNKGFRVSTYQSNGWIRINDYSISYEYGKPELTRGELYEKGDE